MVNWEAFYSSFRAPDFVPGYEIQHRLGGGAFGEVYKARKLSIGKAYAVKFLKLDDQADREAIQRELEHVRLFASIDHPNLVTIEDMGMVMDVPYLIMGYAGEETLARRLKQGALDAEAALRVFVQVCRGVLALHDRRLAHFDLKPGNVFLKGDVARVGDYGLAKLLVEGRSSLSFGRGTPHYMAPEMLRNRADHRADLYSLGVILYECLTGRVPYGESVQSGVIVREDDAPPDFPVHFPGELRGVVETCLRLDPRARFDSVHRLLEELGQTARQGDSVRLPWRPSALSAGEEARLDGPATPRPEAALPPTPPVGGELRQAAGHLARGAVGVARGVWQGVTGRDAADAARDAQAGAPSAPTPRQTPAPTDVISLQTLEDPDEHEVGSSVGLPSLRAPLQAALALERPPPSPVPVPPRGDGGFLGGVTSAVMLGTEILGALLTGPVLALLRGVRALVDRLVRGLPGVIGSAVRLMLFLLLCLGLGAVAALVFMGAVMGGNLYIR